MYRHKRSYPLGQCGERLCKGLSSYILKLIRAGRPDGYIILSLGPGHLSNLQDFDHSQPAGTSELWLKCLSSFRRRRILKYVRQRLERYGWELSKLSFGWTDRREVELNWALVLPDLEL